MTETSQRNIEFDKSFKKTIDFPALEVSPHLQTLSVLRCEISVPGNEVMWLSRG